MTPPISPTDRLFVPQERLAQWVDEGKVTLTDNTLTLIAERRSYVLTEAVRFLRIEGGEPDQLGLVGKVRTKEQLRQLQAEHLMDSVIVGNVAYQVQPGFVGAAPAAAPKPVPRPAPLPTPAPAAGSIAAALEGVAAPAPAGPRSDTELLTDFLLKNLLG